MERQPATAGLRVEGPCACSRADLPEMIALVNSVMRQGTGQTILTDYPLVYRDANLPNVSILKVDGRIVSVVPFIPRPIFMEGCSFTVGIISPTVTHPDHRRKGHAERCLQRALLRMRELGIEISALWTQVPTFPFYERNGYHAARSQSWVYPCGRGDAGLFPDHGEEVRKYESANRSDLDAIRALHASESFGVRRQADEFAVLLNLPRMTTRLALRGGMPAACLVSSRAVNKPGLIEGAGDAVALETLIRRSLAQLGDDESVVAHVPSTSSVLAEVLARRLPSRRQPWTGAHTLFRINSFQAFFKAIAPWLEKRNGGRRREFSMGVTDASEIVSFRFRAGGLVLGTECLADHREFSRMELTSIVFGAHPERPVAVPPLLAEFFPYFFPIAMLDHS